MKRDPLVFGALVAVLVVLASAEYELARACGFGQYVAAGVPAALDIYAIKALRSRRDVPAVVLALIAVNAASHLVAAGLLPVDWPLIVAVSAIAPLVLWRVHRLSEEPVVTPTDGVATVNEKGLHGVETRAESSRVDIDTTAGASCGGIPTPPGRYGNPVVRPAPEQTSALPEPAPEPAEPRPEPITLERVPEPADTPSATPVLGPFTPVAELMGGTTGTSPDLHGSGRPEALPIWAEPAPEPPAEPVPPVGSVGSDLESEDTADTRFDQYVRDARGWLRADPTLTGTDIGTKLGKSDTYGRRVRRAALDALASA